MNQQRQEDPEGLLNPSCVETVNCPSCGHAIELYDQSSIRYLPGLPVGAKFNPSDQEILEHLEAKVLKDTGRMHPLIDEFIPTLEGEDGICCTHPEKLPGLSNDGQARHFFHRPSKAYSTGTRKRRKVQTNPDGSETRWHKTGHSRPILVNRMVRGFKKILVLYTNFGSQRRPEKANWVMHQYHLGSTDEERDGELVVSKVFYQTQPRPCGSSAIVVHDDPGNDKTNPRDRSLIHDAQSTTVMTNHDPIEPSDKHETTPQLIPNLLVADDVRSTFVGASVESSKRKLAKREFQRFN